MISPGEPDDKYPVNGAQDESAGESESAGLDGSATPGMPVPGASGKQAPQQIHDEIILMMRTVYDPEIPVNIYDLGLIYNVDVSENGHVDIQMTLTAPNCPAAEELPAEVQRKAQSVDGVVDVDLDLVWEPPWTKDMMSDAARLELGF